MFPEHLAPGSAKPPFQFPVLKFGRSRFPKVMFTLGLDTLGLTPFAAVAAITITAFNQEGVIETKTILLDYDQQQKDFGRDVETANVRFWLDEQSANRRSMLTAMGERVLADDAISILGAFIETQKAKVKENRTLVWVKGPKFEVSVLETLARDYETELPVSYQEWGDIRTLALLTGISIGRFDGRDGAELTAPEKALKVIEALQKLGLE
ncbi:3'-5' exoribonuclease [Sinorhizobium meliloti]|uniref:3'-5' exoribonuclease domain-containing protein n=1 Tax=Rhizobium meliloti TaxID=382 RepID=UPI00299D7B53|nr:hypothetical protein [Sinorhizobium meliloti]